MLLYMENLMFHQMAGTENGGCALTAVANL